MTFTADSRNGFPAYRRDLGKMLAVAAGGRVYGMACGASVGDREVLRCPDRGYCFEVTVNIRAITECWLSCLWESTGPATESRRPVDVH